MTVQEYIKLYRKSPWYTNDSEYDGDKEADKEKIREYNKNLIKKYPWLEPTNRWSGKKIVACSKGEKGFWPGNQDKLPEYDYEYTELDNMPEGWRIAFGEKICEEIQAELEKADFVDEYRITDIKEKYGSLRWYDSGATEEIYNIISKYEAISSSTCIRCGKEAQWVTTGWISPYCDDCKKELESKNAFYDNFRLIED